MSYKTNPAFIEYNTNNEYRAVYRHHFDMDETKIMEELCKIYGADGIKEMDQETLDELLVDNDKLSKIMDDILNKTRHEPWFKQLYLLGASKWLSEDDGIGQCILLSYDYYYLYHTCLHIFFEYPDQWSNTCPYYIQLYDKLCDVKSDS